MMNSIFLKGASSKGHFSIQMVHAMNPDAPQTTREEALHRDRDVLFLWAPQSLWFQLAKLKTLRGLRRS